MKRKIVNWSVAQLYKERTHISFPEYQREKSLWPTHKKSLLIDSILYDLDIPKLYFYQLKGGSFEVIDGQQRLWSIWEFLDDEYAYERGTGDKVLFSRMPASEQAHITNYTLQITLIEDADEEYLRLLFVRLQLGLLLTAGEKLHAATGRMKNFVFDKLSVHSFVERVGIPERRFAKPTLCAQICINSFTRQKLKRFARTRYEDLSYFFIEYSDPRGKDLEFFQSQTKRILEVVDRLAIIFGDRANRLKNRSFILSVYLLVEERDDIVVKGKKLFADFVFLLWSRLKAEGDLGMDRQNRDLYFFDTLLSSAPGEAYQIERRHAKLVEFFEHYKRTGKIKGDR